MLLQLLWEVNAVVMLDFSEMRNRGRKLNPCELWKSYLKYTKKYRTLSLRSLWEYCHLNGTRILARDIHIEIPKQSPAKFLEIEIFNGFTFFSILKRSFSLFFLNLILNMVQYSYLICNLNKINLSVIQRPEMSFNTTISFIQMLLRCCETLCSIIMLHDL